MSVSFVTSGQLNSAAASAATATQTFNIGTCDAVAFVLITSATVAQSFTVQTWSGATLTKIPSATIVDASGGTIDWFAMVAPATGSHSVQFTWSTSALWIIGFMSFSGVDPTGGTTSFLNGTSVNNGGTTTTTTKTVTSASGDATVFAWENVNAYTGTQTPLADWHTTANMFGEGQHILSVGASDSYTAVMTTPADVMIGAGFHLKAAAVADVLMAQILT
jgi:hypothetical protein